MNDDLYLPVGMIWCPDCKGSGHEFGPVPETGWPPILGPCPVCIADGWIPEGAVAPSADCEALWPTSL